LLIACFKKANAEPLWVEHAGPQAFYSCPSLRAYSPRPLFMLFLASCLQGGGVDFASAYRYFTAAAKKSNPSAQYGLAYMYLTGQGAAEDHEKAYKLFVQVR